MNSINPCDRLPAMTSTAAVALCVPGATVTARVTNSAATVLQQLREGEPRCALEKGIVSVTTLDILSRGESRRPGFRVFPVVPGCLRSKDVCSVSATMRHHSCAGVPVERQASSITLFNSAPMRTATLDT